MHLIAHVWVRNLERELRKAKQVQLGLADSRERMRQRILSWRPCSVCKFSQEKPPDRYCNMCPAYEEIKELLKEDLQNDNKD